MGTPIFLKPSHSTPTCLCRWNRQSVPKGRYTKFRRRGITQKKAYNSIYVTDAWRMELSSLKNASSQPWPHDANFVVTVPENGVIQREMFRLEPPWEITLWDVVLSPGKDDTFLRMGAPISLNHTTLHTWVCIRNSMTYTLYITTVSPIYRLQMWSVYYIQWRRIKMLIDL
jgi:hypothetical protein